jgi:xylulokinase
MPPHTQPHILAIDVGTSALKAALYGAGGRLLAAATRRYEPRVPQPGWAEADATEWWTALTGALSDLGGRGFDLRSVQAIGLTGQMHTPVLLDEAGEVLAPTILWLDRRAVAETAELKERLGLPPQQLNSTYTLPKLLWLSRHRPDVVARTRTLLWPKDYLRYRLTGQPLSDVTEAGGAALLDWEQGVWATDRLALTGFAPSVLPPLRSPNADAGALLPIVADALGLSPTARVIVGAGDVIALLGNAPTQPGRFSCSLGNSCMVSIPLAEGQTIHDPRWRLYVYPLLPVRLLNGVLSTSGAALTWAWRALYGKEAPLETVLDAANAAPPGGEGLFFLPFLAGERSPYWNDALRGGFYGLSLAHDRAQMVRAVLEGVGYSLRHLVEIAEELGVPVHEIALAGGGAAVRGWPQIIADVCQRPVLIYSQQEAVTRPLYAYCATTLDPTISFEQALLRTFDTSPNICTPNPELATVYESIYRAYRSLAHFVSQVQRTYATASS